MKSIRLLAFIWITFYSFFSFSQSAIYGINQRGGNGSGHIFKYSTADHTFKVVYNFQTFLGQIGTNNEFLAHPNGKLYSFVVLPCSIGVCSYNPASNNYQIVAQTDYYADMVFGKPVLGTNKLLYSIGGWASESRLIFSYNVQTNRLDTAAYFKPNHGNPISGLTAASDGKFYFNTSAAICCFDPGKPAADAISVLKYIGGLTGELAEFEKGMLYGHTPSNIFSFDYTQNTFEIKAQLSAPVPNGFIKSSYDGMLYGLCQGQGASSGQLYRFNPQTNQVSVLYTFDNNSSYRPKGKLTQIGNKLYGTASYGTQGSGNIFSYNVSTSEFQNQFQFTDPVGGSQYPMGTLALHKNGNLYALAASGAEFSGSVVQFNPTTSDLRAVIRFYPPPIPTNYPSGKSMVLASNGLLYGIFINYPNYLFSFDPASNTYQNRSKLPLEKDFYNLTDAGNNTLYLSALDKNSSSFNNSYILKYDTQTDSITTVYNATGFPKMTYMIAGNDSELYGYCQATNYDDLGLCKFSPGTQSITLIKQFYGTSLNPSQLQKSASGKIIGIPMNKYGTGGTTLFSYDPATSTFEYLHQFPGNETTNYPTDFCIGNDQKVYGIRMDPQLKRYLFSYDLLENSYRSNIELDFGLSNSPYSQLVMGIDNLIYGTDSKLYSPKIKGSLFSIDPNTEAFETIHHAGPGCGTYGSGLVEVRNPNPYNQCESGHCWYLFPNPSSGTITLNLLQGEIPNSLKIYNAMGQLVLETNQLKAYQKLSIEHLTSGVYRVKMDFSDASVTTSLIKY
ncbi:T9SS type A sorting domain-containing protein [Fluviicola sp.]|uniref:T9SS type A sorting domain-containing protein n=1 Tax=Fluviicola sp. TaxID=1917219 RepID=UPI002607C820|nr:T9SS type A sorting domain-containing protein [Fluviicola sp.]